MRKLKLIFSILTVVFASLGLAKILSYDISLPLMFVSMILTFLVWSKECYDKGSKRDSYIFLGVAIFIAAITAFNIISTLSSKDKSTEIPKGNPQFMATVLGFEDNYILVDVFASLGLAKILSYDISLPLMFVSMILTFLVWSKECYDKGSKRDSYIFLGVAIFIAAITAFNIISTLSSKDKSTEIPKGNPQFMATVLLFEDNYILVDPYKGDEAINSMDMALVSTDVISKIDVPDVKEGDKISVEMSFQRLMSQMSKKEIR